ncbi:hypothetical protein DEM27_26090 [Metarhizobium album]|uniref:C4-dicarboxylate ABC transporter substrate-binding protein n=2 Tax=Metarhizobium album TaxID=2182425 RepID=A0A2U2DJG9_9HYPH|nr:hypothetical protein DEM27_26090 [Rhizobium album]
MRKLLAAFVIAIAAAVTGAGGSSAQEYTMKFGTTSVNDPQTAFLKMYKEDLERATGGRIKVDLYPQGQLGNAPRMIEAVQIGSLEATMVPLDFYVGVDPRFGVFGAPMLFRDEPQAQKTIHDPEVEKALFSIARTKGLQGLGAEVIGFHGFGASTAILTLNDFKGKKLRINGTPFEKMEMALLGATGVGMPLSEVMPALSQGTVDGIASHISVFVSFKMNDVAGTFLDTRASVVASLAVVSSTWFDGLPPDLQKAVLASATNIRPALDRWTAEFNEGQLRQWTDMGGKIVTLSPDEHAKLEQLFTPVGDGVTKEQSESAAMLKLVRDAAARN